MFMVQNKKAVMMLKSAKLFALAPTLLMLTGCAGISNAPNLQQMLESIRSTLPSLWVMIMVFCIVAGASMSVKGLFDLHIVAKMSGSMMGAQASYGPPLIMMGIAAMLLVIPGYLQVFTTTIFGQSGSSALAYQPLTTGNYPFGLSACIDLIRFISFVAFIRGIFLFSNYGHRNSQVRPGDFGKACTHVTAGILGVNIVTTWGVLMATLGIGQ